MRQLGESGAAQLCGAGAKTQASKLAADVVLAAEVAERLKARWSPHAISANHKIWASLHRMSYRTDTGHVSLRPHLMCFPFLAMREPCRVGPWNLLPAEDACTADWSSDEFKKASFRMLRTFRYGIGHFKLENPTLVSSAESRFTGEQPTNEERDFLTAAVAFSALDNNREPFRTSRRTSPSPQVVAENVDYWEFPVSAEDTSLTIPTGRRYRVLICDEWSPDNPIIGPSVLTKVPNGFVTINTASAEMLYCALSAGTRNADRLLTSIRYFVESWRNQSGVVGISNQESDYGNIIVTQQIALEALLGNDSGSVSERIIQTVSDRVRRFTDMDNYGSLEEAISNLGFDWPKERRNYYLDSKQESQFKEWARTHVKVRNKTIHEGNPLKPFKNLPTEKQQQKLQQTVEDANRVLLDAIRVTAALA